LANHKVTFQTFNKTVEVPTGSLVAEAIQQAELDISQPCGGQGRCGRCAVIIEEGTGARRRSTIRLSKKDLDAGFALACQTVIEGDLTISIPDQEIVARRIVTDKSARKIELPFPFDPARMQRVKAFQIALPEPTLDDNRDDLSRLETSLASHDIHSLEVPLPLLRQLGKRLREADWSPWVVMELEDLSSGKARLIDLCAEPIQPMGLALDIGTTTVTAYLVDLETGKVLNSAAEYNGQIARGEDVISRIIYAGKEGGLEDLATRIRATLDTLLERLKLRTGIPPEKIHKITVTGNTTMIHLFLALPPDTIRLTPYIPLINHPSSYQAHSLDLHIHPYATVECLPGVASYVGADITAGVLSCGMLDSEDLSLFIDVGTNGEMVLGNSDWMVTCACSAGPAFEGAGVLHGMRATEGAIEEVWVSSKTYEPTFRVIGDVKPRGICGSGLIALLAELFVTGVLDRGGNIKVDLETPRTRRGEHGSEYVLAWAEETENGEDIALTEVDVENLMRAKAAIYAGCSVLASKVDVDLADVQQVLIGGAFGKYINVEKAIQIGLLPDLPWERFHFLGNTSVQGAYMALLSEQSEDSIGEIARKMTYIELSADNTFFDAFTAALFLPHTEIQRFPSVAKVWRGEKDKNSEGG
jgi:uncharacterized 2Fe-2S/4Fe-4S cluster protein (DUF4445 family)